MISVNYKVGLFLFATLLVYVASKLDYSIESTNAKQRLLRGASYVLYGVSAAILITVIIL